MLRGYKQHHRQLHAAMLRPQHARRWMSTTRSSEPPRTVEIGGVVAHVKDATSIELVPRGYLPQFQSREMSQELLGHLRWMLQKDMLKQDMFLIGPPGASRRLLSMRFCELLNKEVEYIAISQDTTESDLKQRREILRGAAIFTDQAPVRAAIHGRVLVIDGLEKAERNVLPTLNNLLENREMTLDDGRFLMKAESYDALVAAGYSTSDLTAQNLVRVHPDFRVIALGLPVPPYPGRTLDPPLRSRFQARSVQPSSPGTQLEALVAIAPSVPLATLERLVGIREAVNAIEAMHDSGASSGSNSQRMPHLDYLSLAHVAKVLALFPAASVSEIVTRVFPVTTDVLGRSAGNVANSATLQRILKTKVRTKQPQEQSSAQPTTYVLQDVVKHDAAALTADVTFSQQLGGQGEQVDEIVVSVPCGTTALRTAPLANFVETPVHATLVSAMLQDHAAGSDLCLVGEKGSGKSALARLFAHRLGYATELFSLFKDMTTRDLLQRRTTDAHGNTAWDDSPLIHAARHGHVAVLDGVHRLGSDSLSVLQRLVQDREIDLADGTKLVAQHKFDAIVADATANNVVLPNRVSPIHPSFRIVAIAESDAATAAAHSKSAATTTAWLSSDSIAMFTFHFVPTLPAAQSAQVVQALFPRLDSDTTQMLLTFSDKLRQAKAKSSDSAFAALNLSTRQLLRACRRLDAFPGAAQHDLRPLLHETLLTQFLPASCVRLVDSILDDCGAPVKPTPTSSSTKQHPPATMTIREANGQLLIGDVSHPIAQAPTNPELVPQPLYFDIPKHTKTMHAMLQDVVAGQKHLLLIGNQGVGKNKLADRLLQLLQQEREYIQLHRDTTVQTLTLVPSLVDGKIVWDDSPLVRAAKTGRTLLVDEADKAPLEVVCVLKGLIEDGEMLLGNGKRLIDPTKVVIEDWHDESQIIRVHPDFRMWVLANRPGFPFHGNNFFREIGDVFASHAIENPDEASELALLQAYAPNVSIDILKRLCQAFAELRDLVDRGVMTYPYSTREAVAVAKHLELFPHDGVTSVLENVLAFDAYDTNVRKQLADVFLRHGIPLSHTGKALALQVNLAPAQPLPPFVPTETWHWDTATTMRWDFAAASANSSKTNKTNKRKDATALSSGLFEAPLQRRDIWLEPATSRTFSVQQHRMQTFTEEVASFRVPLTANRRQRAHAMAVLPDNSVHVLTTCPMSLHSFADIESSNRSHTVVEIENQYMEYEKEPVLVRVPERDELGVFIPSTGLCVLYNPSSSGDGRASCFTLPDSVLTGDVHRSGGGGFKTKAPHTPFGKWFSSSNQTKWRTVVDAAANPGTIVRFEQGGSIVQLVDLVSNRLFSIDLRTAMASSDTDAVIDELVSVQAVGANEWTLQTTDDTVVYALRRDSDAFTLQHARIDRLTSSNSIDTRRSIAPQQSQLPPNSSDKRVMVHPHAYLQTLAQQVDDATRTSVRVESALRDVNAPRDGIDAAWTTQSGDVANTTAFDQVDLEVTSPWTQSTKLIVLDAAAADAASRSEERSRIAAAVESHAGRYFATLQSSGDVRFWQIDGAAIDRDVSLWRQMFGVSDDASNTNNNGLQLKVNGVDASPESIPKTGLDAPKFGKEDAKNEPHVGGNTWAGGTGGSDTAGLGGRGGPYRLDKGHPVHQVSQAKKDEVSTAARERAAAMARDALAARLREIDMSDREHATYARYFARVERESAQLRSILTNLEATTHERTWLKHQSSGEWDDAKLVDSVTGDRLVYKRRGVSDSPFQSPHDVNRNQQSRKRLVFVMDVSGSMYRFNGQDGRLERMLETTLMLMESFAGFDATLEYCIMGHSGDAAAIPFVEFGAPPIDRKARLQVLQRMAAHTQYCRSGDHTVEAIDCAVALAAAASLNDGETDDRFVFVVSDANLERYDIQPTRLGKQLIADPQVQAHAIFIASFANEAARIQRALPPGRGHVCLDTAELPLTFKRIFASAMEH